MVRFVFGGEYGIGRDGAPTIKYNSKAVAWYIVKWYAVGGHGKQWCNMAVAPVIIRVAVCAGSVKPV